LTSNKSLLAHKISIDKDNLAVKLSLKAFKRKLWFKRRNLEKKCVKLLIQEKTGAKERNGEEKLKNIIALT